MVRTRSGGTTDDAPAAQRLKRTASHSSTNHRDGVGYYDVPSSLVSGRIFDFLVGVESLQFLRDGFDLPRHKAQLTPLACVCREWRGLAQARLAHAKHVSCTLKTRSGSAQEHEQLLKQAAEEGATALELTVVMGEVIHEGILHEKHSVTRKYQDVQWWETLLACFPNVVRLDLTLVSLAMVPAVLEIASRLCPKVKSLGLLCGPMNHDDENWESFPMMTTALCDALKTWYETNGGLRVLTMPAFVGHMEAQYEQFFRAVASYCPQIEYLLSSAKHEFGSDMLEDWPCLSVDAWGEFCRKCPLIREITWNIVPFSSEYVEEFAATPKLQLQELKLFYHTSEPWQEDLTPLARVLDAAPRLGSLHLEFGGELEDEDESEDEDETEASKPKVSMSTKIVSLVASKCPQLEHVSVQDASDNRVHGISGEAVDALVRLESAFSLELPSVSSLNDQTLVEMLRSTLNSTEYSSRTVEIGADDYIYNAIMEMLQFMEQQPAEKFEDVSLELTVRGSYRENEGGAIIMPTPARKLKPKPLEKLVEAVKQKHNRTLSYIHVDVATKRVGNRVLQYVEEFHLLINVSRRDIKAFKRARAEDNGYMASDLDSDDDDILDEGSGDEDQDQEDGDEQRHREEEEQAEEDEEELEGPLGGVVFQKEPRIQYY